MAERMLNEQVARRFMMASCVAATLAAIVTTGLSFGGVLGGNLFNLLDVAIFAGLAFGVYRTSRTCAIALLVYHLGNRFIMYRRSEDPATAFGLLAIAMTAAYFLGVLGTFAIHAIEAEKRAATGSSRMLKNYS